MKQDLPQNDKMNPKVQAMMDKIKEREKKGRYIRVDEKTQVLCRKGEDPKKKVEKYLKLMACHKKRILSE